jgi:hypothetical protein
MKKRGEHGEVHETPRIEKMETSCTKQAQLCCFQSIITYYAISNDYCRRRMRNRESRRKWRDDKGKDKKREGPNHFTI